MRKHIVAGNWKMNCTFTEADDLINGIMEKLEQQELPRDTQLIVCPPFPYLEMTTDYANDSYFMVGAQNVAAEEKGADTREVSAEMLESMGASRLLWRDQQDRGRQSRPPAGPWP